MVEVFDPILSQLLGSVRIDPDVTHVLADGLISSYWEDTFGNPYIDIWEISIAR